MIQFDQKICTDPSATLSREWLETNGLGGFASSTLIGLNTRRYHGLLVAATKPPVGRVVMLSKLEETLVIDGVRFDLSANRYPGVIHPQGFRYLTSFRLDPFPIFTYQVEGVEIEKSVFMVQGENSTVVQYSLNSLSNKPLQLEVRPLIAFRDYHSLTHENGAIKSEFENLLDAVKLTPYQGLPSLFLAHNGAEIAFVGDWYRNFEYDAERERGLDFTEDLFNPLMMKFNFAAGVATIIASTELRDAKNAELYKKNEIARRQKLPAASPIADNFARALSSAADQYIVARKGGNTVIAGYHWFSDWGRDTMIALPGLTLLTSKHDVTRSILRTFAKSVDRGMLPNRFPDAGETPEYNTVDATLWFFETARHYLAYTNDWDFVRKELYPVFTDIIVCHIRGTRYGIKVDSTGLLCSGEAGVQLTWMDAKIGDWVVTPRRGKPVEIQALWYNALRTMEDIAHKFGFDAEQKQYEDMAAAASRSFNQLYWNEETGCLYDVLNGAAPDPSLRPNQVLAISLNYSMLSTDRAKSILEKVQDQLLTPYGLRSLAPSDPNYRGRYTGGQAERDAAYHQGTVWPWLMGPFITAYVKTHGYSETVREQAAKWLQPLEKHLTEAGLGHISEIFEGDAPHRPCGCVAQAWSVAEVLRAYLEDVKGISSPCTVISR